MKDKFTYFLIAIVFLSLGLILGVLIQQMIIQSSIIKIVSSMEGVEINIDELNETEIVDGEGNVCRTKMNQGRKKGAKNKRKYETQEEKEDMEY